MSDTNIDNNCLMGNTHNEILGEMKSLLESLRMQIAELEEKVSGLEACTGEVTAEPSAYAPLTEAISFDDLDSMPEVDLSEFDAPAPEIAAAPEVRVEPEVVAAPEVRVEPVAPAVPEEQASEVSAHEVTAAPETPGTQLVEDLPADEEDPPFFMTGDKDDVNTVIAKQVRKKTVAEAMEAKMLWKTAIPGSEVKDVRSAISLNDRVLFINKLFSENPAEFQQTVSVINTATSLEELIEYFSEHYPQWNMDSDLVFRFMMAVRRKVRS